MPFHVAVGSRQSDCDRPTSLTELGVSSSAAQERYSNDNMDQLQRFGEQQYARVGTDGVVCTPGGGGAVGEEDEEGEDEGGGGDDSAVGYPQEEDDAPCCDGPGEGVVLWLSSSWVLWILGGQGWRLCLSCSSQASQLGFCGA